MTLLEERNQTDSTESYVGLLTRPAVINVLGHITLKPGQKVRVATATAEAEDRVFEEWSCTILSALGSNALRIQDGKDGAIHYYAICYEEF